MNFFEQELQKLFADGTVISGPTFSGRACLGTLGKDLRVRAEFVTTRKPRMNLVGTHGDIHSLTQRASWLLTQAGQQAQADEMYQRVYATDDSFTAVKIISEYVETELSSPNTTKTKKENYAHE